MKLVLLPKMRGVRTARAPSSAACFAKRSVPSARTIAAFTRRYVVETSRDCSAAINRRTARPRMASRTSPNSVSAPSTKCHSISRSAAKARKSSDVSKVPRSPARQRIEAGALAFGASIAPRLDDAIRLGSVSRQVIETSPVPHAASMRRNRQGSGADTDVAAGADTGRVRVSLNRCSIRDDPNV